jgi:hypothetical protein
MNPGELKETLSSGLLSFQITDFDNAVACDDYATVSRLIDEFFLPYLEIRSRRAGYAVSIIKARARLGGYDAGFERAGPRKAKTSLESHRSEVV